MVCKILAKSSKKFMNSNYKKNKKKKNKKINQFNLQLVYPLIKSILNNN